MITYIADKIKNANLKIGEAFWLPESERPSSYVELALRKGIKLKRIGVAVDGKFAGWSVTRIE